MGAVVTEGSVSSTTKAEQLLGSDAHAGPQSWLRQRGRLTAVVALLALAHALTTTFLAIRQHNSFASYGWDFGIYEQAAWMVSEDGFDLSSFISIRGLPVWGHHVNVVFFWLAPFFKLGAGARFLITLQSLSIASGALPIAWLGRKWTGRTSFGLMLAAVFLLHPATAWYSQILFHPEKLAVSSLLFMFWFAETRRWKLFWVAAIFSLSCREEVALVTAAFGVLWALKLVLQGKRRTSFLEERPAILNVITLLLASVGWFIVCSNVIIPAALGGDAYYVESFYGEYGDSSGEVVMYFAKNPAEVATLFESRKSQTYFLDLFGPLSFLPLLSPLTLVAAPTVLGVFLSKNPSFLDIRTHYSSLMLPGFFLGLAQVTGWASRRRYSRFAVVVLLGVMSVSGALLRGPLPLTRGSEAWVSNHPKEAAFRKALTFVPQDAAVSVDSVLAPHLAQRRVVYQFPNPFSRFFYGEFAGNDHEGVSAAPASYPAPADWIVMDVDAAGSYRKELATLTAPSGPFEVIFLEDDVLVAKRKEVQGAAEQTK
jgi:uncharacterized membrane protein